MKNCSFVMTAVLFIVLISGSTASAYSLNWLNSTESPTVSAHAYAWYLYEDRVVNPFTAQFQITSETGRPTETITASFDFLAQLTLILQNTIYDGDVASSVSGAYVKGIGPLGDIAIEELRVRYDYPIDMTWDFAAPVTVELETYHTYEIQFYTEATTFICYQHPGGWGQAHATIATGNWVFPDEGTPTAESIPEPTTALLIGTGLVGFAVPQIKRKFKK